MAKPSRRSTKTTSRPRESCESCDSYETYESESTAPTSIYASTETASVKDTDTTILLLPTEDAAVGAGPSSGGPIFQPVYEEDISPSTSCYPRSSVDTYNSALASEEDLDHDDLTNGSGAYYDEYRDLEVPTLPIYRRRPLVDPNVRPSTPQDFAKLFPSMNRLSIRHDDFTPDGNLNLRVDTLVPGHRQQRTMQLFHLRMYDLAKREFSLRRYCRDSGREVCNSKRKFIESPPPPPPLPLPSPVAEEDPAATPRRRSMTSAIKSLGGHRKPFLARTNSAASGFASVFGSGSKDALAGRESDLNGRGGGSFPGGSRSFSFNDATTTSSSLLLQQQQQQRRPRPTPTNTIKLEFSNYARVDVSRHGNRASKRYEFEWWGHKYHWKRVVDQNLGTVSFHLHRDASSHSKSKKNSSSSSKSSNNSSTSPPSSSNTNSAIAHLVPETRSPTQVDQDYNSGSWVPPCHMWISDQSVLDAVTDVADVIVATGLMALVDDCIKERWQNKSVPKLHRVPLPLTSKTVDFQYVGPRAFVQSMFHRKGHQQQQQQQQQQGARDDEYRQRAVQAY